MDRQRVLEALEVLRAELAGAERVDDEARAELERVSAEIERLVEKEQTDAAQARGEASGLQEALLEFEAEHPQLTGAINQVAAALANLGI
jgi:hypothetical protein